MMLWGFVARNRAMRAASIRAEWTTSHASFVSTPPGVSTKTPWNALLTFALASSGEAALVFLCTHWFTYPPCSYPFSRDTGSSRSASNRPITEAFSMWQSRVPARLRQVKRSIAQRLVPRTNRLTPAAIDRTTAGHCASSSRQCTTLPQTTYGAGAGRGCRCRRKGVFCLPIRRHGRAPGAKTSGWGLQHAERGRRAGANARGSRPLQLA